MSTTRSLLLCKKHLETAISNLEIKKKKSEREKELEAIVLALREENIALKNRNRTLTKTNSYNQKLLRTVASAKRAGMEVQKIRLICNKCKRSMVPRRKWKKQGSIPKAFPSNSLTKPLKLPILSKYRN